MHNQIGLDKLILGFVKQHLRYFLVLFLGLIMINQVQAVDIQDPRFPTRQYRDVTLSNGMRVWLISDSTVQKSALSLLVDAGSKDDPEDALGLAHFLEHMLFISTKKYPKVNEYSQIVSSHGGSNNAYTARDHTNYFFDIPVKYLPEVLDRFAQFFIEPTFDPKYLNKEMHAVDAEFSKNKLSDLWRGMRVMQMAMKPGHPEAKFNIGSLDTLKHVDRDRIKQFYATHYSSDHMYLSVLSSQSLDELEKIVAEVFSKVPQRKLDLTELTPPLYPEHKNIRLVQQKTVQDVKLLELTYQIPSIWLDYDNKPVSIISHLIGEESKGSLFSALKKADLVTGLSTGSESQRNYGLFSIDVELTEKGLKQYQQVIAITNQYIDILKQKHIPDYVFSEMKTMAKYSFKYETKHDGLDVVAHYTRLMPYLSGKDLLTKPYEYKSYKPELYTKYLDYFTPSNTIALLQAKSLPTDKQEHYFGVEYAIGDLPSIVLNSEYSALVSDMYVAEKNKYVPEKMSLIKDYAPFTFTQESKQGLLQEGFSQEWVNQLSMQEKWQSWSQFEKYLDNSKISIGIENKDKIKKSILDYAQYHPESIIDNQKAKVWYQADARFELPKAVFIVSLYTNNADDPLKNHLLADLYVDMLKDELSEFIYPATLAGLQVEMRAVRAGISIEFYGFSDKLLMFAEAVIKRMQALNMPENRFITIKQDLVHHLENHSYESLMSQSSYLQDSLLKNRVYPIRSLLNALSDIDLSAVKSYADNVFATAYIKAVAHGNISKAEVTASMENIQGYIKQGLPIDKRFQRKVVALRPDQQVKMVNLTGMTDSATKVVIQFDKKTPKLFSELLIFQSLLYPDFFTELRTKQQLGYIVAGYMKKMKDILGLEFYVQSQRYAPDELASRIQQYWEDNMPKLLDIDEQRFAQLKQTVLANLLERNKTMVDTAWSIYNLAFNENEKFDLRSSYIQALLSLDKKDIHDFSNKYLSDPEKFKSLQIQMHSKSHPPLPKGLPSFEQDYKVFKSEYAEVEG